MSAIIGIAGISYALYFVFTTPAAGFTGFFDEVGLVMLLLMPPSIMLLSHTIKDFVVGISVLFKAMFRRQVSAQVEVINVLTQASALVRSDGMGALMQVKDRIRYELLRDGISLIVNNFTNDEIRHNIMAKINTKQSRLQLAANLFENMSKVCPGVGMIGTIIGLADMMSNLNDPSKIGGGMALAMITTLYGLMLGTIIYAPCAEKISLEAEKSLEIDLMVLDGVLSLKGKKSSIHMKDIMKTYGSGNHRHSQMNQGA